MCGDRPYRSIEDRALGLNPSAHATPTRRPESGGDHAISRRRTTRNSSYSPGATGATAVVDDGTLHDQRAVLRRNCRAHRHRRCLHQRLHRALPRGRDRRLAGLEYGSATTAVNLTLEGDLAVVTPEEDDAVIILIRLRDRRRPGLRAAAFALALRTATAPIPPRRRRSRRSPRPRSRPHRGSARATAAIRSDPFRCADGRRYRRRRRFDPEPRSARLYRRVAYRTRDRGDASLALERSPGVRCAALVAPIPQLVDTDMVMVNLSLYIQNELQ